MPGSAFVPNFMARHVEIHSREGSEHWLTVLARLEMFDWRMLGLPGSAAAAGVSCIKASTI